MYTEECSTGLFECGWRENLLILQRQASKGSWYKRTRGSSILHGRNTFLRRKLLAVFSAPHTKDWPPIYTRYEGQCGGSAWTSQITWQALSTPSKRCTNTTLMMSIRISRVTGPGLDVAWLYGLGRKWSNLWLAETTSLNWAEPRELTQRSRLTTSRRLVVVGQVNSSFGTCIMIKWD